MRQQTPKHEKNNPYCCGRVEAKKDMLDKNETLRSMYKENDDNTIVFYMRNATATISSFTSDPESFTF